MLRSFGSAEDQASLHAGLVGTVQGLRDGLRTRGSELLVLRGPLEERLPALAAAVGAARIVTEDEVEYRHDSRSPTARVLAGYLGA